MNATVCDPPNSALTNDCNGATVRKPEGAGGSLTDGEYGGGLPRNETERRAEQEEDEYPRRPLTLDLRICHSPMSLAARSGAPGLSIQDKELNP